LGSTFLGQSFWRIEMRHVAIIYKRFRPDAAKMALDLKEWLEERGVSVFCHENIDDSQSSASFKYITVPETVELMVVLGGDGTLLSVARIIEDHPIPIIGVNLGGLGFLTEISIESCISEMENILAGRYEVEERMRLHVSVQRNNRQVFFHRILNDAVVNKGALARIVDLKTSIDGRFLTHYHGDGLIVATPTGSTAYNLSAGGPIVYPTASAIILTPICSFTLSNRPIILPAHVTVQVELGEPIEDVTLTCDGQVGCELAPSDTILISACSTPIRLLKTPSIDYFEILRTKLKWGQF
jgi:NAD+ kinase